MFGNFGNFKNKIKKIEMEINQDLFDIYLKDYEIISCFFYSLNSDTLTNELLFKLC